MVETKKKLVAKEEELKANEVELVAKEEELKANKVELVAKTEELEKARTEVTQLGGSSPGSVRRSRR